MGHEVVLVAQIVSEVLQFADMRAKAQARKFFHLCRLTWRFHGSIDLRAIAQERVLSTGGATRLVDRMEAAGLVTRVADADDRRGRRVRLTPAGEQTTVRAARLHA